MPETQPNEQETPVGLGTGWKVLLILTFFISLVSLFHDPIVNWLFK